MPRSAQQSWRRTHAANHQLKQHGHGLGVCTAAHLPMPHRTSCNPPACLDSCDMSMSFYNDTMDTCVSSGKNTKHNYDTTCERVATWNIT